MQTRLSANQSAYYLSYFLKSINLTGEYFSFVLEIEITQHDIWRAHSSARRCMFGNVSAVDG